MIPKKIHYCWFGRGEKPKLAQRCIASWRKYCPDYEIIEWNEDNFDIARYPYAQYCLNEAYVRILAVNMFSLPPWGYLYALRPIFVGLMPGWLYNMMHKRRLA